MTGCLAGIAPDRVGRNVNTNIRRIYEKLYVRSRSQAVAKFSHISLDNSHRLPARHSGKVSKNKFL